VLTRLKEIIRDNLLFHENNPSIIVGDAPLEAALGKKEVHVNEIRGVVQRQLILVEASQGPLGEGMLAATRAREPWRRQPRLMPPVGESWTLRRYWVDQS
jgi:hypothetical protein